MKQIAIFDLDGTLIQLRIDRDDFERRRAFWVAYLAQRGVQTTLKPIWPELEKAVQTPAGRAVKADILQSLDELELAAGYFPLGRIDAVLTAVKAQFHKLVLVTHNGAAFWQRLAVEHSWPHLFDLVITRDEIGRFKPDPRACEVLWHELAAAPSRAECWVIGNADVDRGLGFNLRQRYPHLIVRTFLVDPTLSGAENAADQLDIDINSVDSLLPWTMSS